MIQVTGWQGGTLSVGDEAVFSRAFTEAEMATFIGLTGDWNPYHVDPAFMAATRFGRPILPGLLVGAMLSHVGGMWAVLAHDVRYTFLLPVYPGQTVTLRMKVAAISEKNRATFDATWTNEAGETVLTATLHGYPPREQERRLLIDRKP
jgi:acyl dehydratase